MITPDDSAEPLARTLHADSAPPARVPTEQLVRGAMPGSADAMPDPLHAAVRANLFPESPTTRERLGRFELVARRGEGGMGVVFEAHDPQLARRVAIKLLHSSAGQVEQRLRREAQAMARLSHPNVVQVYESGTHRGRVYVVMELVEGVTLREWLAAPRTQGEALEMLRQVGRGLVAAHAAGLVHRDFKPENVLVGADGRPRVLDFGLARALDHEGEGLRATAHDDPGPALTRELTVTGAIMGTPAYMSPEQFFGEPADARSDQYSFSVVLYEAIFGARPYTAGGYAELSARVTNGDGLVFPREANAPAWLVEALRRGLSVEAARRFDTMAALLEAITPATSDGAPRRRWMLGAAALTLALAAGGWLATRSPSAPGEPAPRAASAPIELEPQTEPRAEPTRAEPTPDPEALAVMQAAIERIRARARQQGPAPLQLRARAASDVEGTRAELARLERRLELPATHADPELEDEVRRGIASSYEALAYAHLLAGDAAAAHATLTAAVAAYQAVWEVGLRREFAIVEQLPLHGLLRHDAEARRAWFALLKAYPDGEHAAAGLLAYADTVFDRGRYEDAVTLYEKALSYERAPILGLARYRLGWARHHLGHHEESLASLLAAIEAVERGQAGGEAVAAQLDVAARLDLVIPFVELKRAREATAFFKQYAVTSSGADLTEELLERLSRRYAAADRDDDAALVCAQLQRLRADEGCGWLRAE